MKRVVKNILRVTTCLIPVGLVVGFSTNWSRETLVSCVGSSGVMPFVQSLAKSYDSKSADITVEAGGSGFGIEQVAKGFADIGDASKNPYEAVQPEGNNGFRQEWTNKHIKTVTIGWEAICMVYIPPKGINASEMTDLLYVKSNQTLQDSNINNLLKIFSGYTNGSHGVSNRTLGAFVNTNSSHYTLTIANKLNATNIIPYVRTGGALVSGTAASFYNGTHFSGVDSGDNSLDEDQVNAFKYGNYGNDIDIYSTDEANSRAWDMFSAQNIPGSMVYLSSGFIEQNRALINNKGYGIMAYQKAEGSQIMPYAINNVDATYNWFRPLNMILSCDSDDLGKDFIQWLLGDGQDLLAGLGAKKLEETELHSMYAITTYTWEEFWLSNDVTKAGSNVWTTDQVFGALDDVSNSS